MALNIAASLCGGRKVHMPGWSSDLMDKGSKVIRNAYKLAAAWCDKKHFASGTKLGTLIS